MAGTAKTYSSALIAKGPCDVWLDMAVPAAGAGPALHTDGTPDSTGNPSAKHLGLTRSGCKFSWKYTVERTEADELTSPYRSILQAEELSIEGEFLQILDFVLLQAMTTGGTSSTPTGGSLIEIGGLNTIATKSVTLIFALPEDPTKFAAFGLYKGFQEQGIEATITRRQDAGSPFRFVGQSVTTRAAGKQVGYIYKQT